MKKLLFSLCTIALVAAPAAGAKELLGAQLCGADGCATQRDATLLQGPGGPLSGNSAVAAPTKPGPWFRASLLMGDRGKVYGKLSFFYVPDGNLIVEPGEGGQPTTWLHPDAPLRAMLETLAARLKPLPMPPLTEVAVNGKPVADPESYLALYSVAGKATRYPTDVRSVQVTFQSERPSPWTTGNSLVVYPASRLLVRDGQIVALPAAMADRVARGASLHVVGGFPWLLALAAAGAAGLLSGLLVRFRPRPAPRPAAQA